MNFNAWTTDFSEDPLVAFLGEMNAGLDEYLGEPGAATVPRIDAQRDRRSAPLSEHNYSPPADEFKDIHPMSLPLMLPESLDIRQDWLDPASQDVDSLNPLLTSKLHEPYLATPIGTVSAWNEIGPAHQYQPVFRHPTSLYPDSANSQMGTSGLFCSICCNTVS